MGGWGAAARKETLTTSDFSVFSHSGSALPGPPQEETATFPRSAGCAETPTRLSSRPCTSPSQRPYPQQTRTYTHLRPCCRSPQGYRGGCPPGSAQPGSGGRKGGEEGWDPDPGQVPPRSPAPGTDMEEGRQSLKNARRREVGPDRPRPLHGPFAKTRESRPPALCSRGEQATCFPESRTRNSSEVLSTLSGCSRSDYRGWTAGESCNRCDPTKALLEPRSFSDA